MRGKVAKGLNSIEPEPMAAASLSQVHAATLPGGAAVVVKVQRQGIRDVIETDLAVLAELARGVTIAGFIFSAAMGA